jgi:glycosyltransferase involved in cell wall biosynthesis
MAQIIFFCPSVTVINGGIKHIFRMTEALIALGHNACVFEQSEQRPKWFPSTAPIVGQSVFKSDASQLYVLPEDQPHILEDFKKLPGRKVIYSQNHFYGALGIGDADSYADYGVTDILCSSKTIYDHCRVRHPTLRAFIIPCAVDQALFKPAAIKHNVISFMPRKRSIEATYIRDMFRFQFPQYRDWKWQELNNFSESEIAGMMGASKVFLSLSRLEGFGLTPLEAMAAGCVVAGFTGIGGREYATEQNGFWANEDDFPTCVNQLKKAVDLSISSDMALNTYKASCQKTLATYTPESFNQAVKDAWAQIVAS